MTSLMKWYGSLSFIFLLYYKYFLIFRSYKCTCSYKDNPLEDHNVIIASFCPQVFGLYVVKLCICLTLAGQFNIHTLVYAIYVFLSLI